MLSSLGGCSVCLYQFYASKVKKDVIINADAMRLYREDLIDIGKAGMSIHRN